MGFAVSSPLNYAIRSTDPVWSDVASEAGCSPGECPALWLALMEYAATQKPRGTLRGIPLVGVAASFGWPYERVAAIYRAMQARGIHDGVTLFAWDGRQLRKPDPTAGERKRRQRAKVVGVDGHATSRRDHPPKGVCHETSRNVTMGGDKEGGSFSSSSTPKDHSPSDTPRAARVCANAGEVWAWLQDHGMPVGSIARALNLGAARQAADWLRHGVTTDHLAEALRRAQRRRQSDRDQSPVNVGFFASFLDDVLAGRPERISHAQSIPNADDAADAYLRGRT